SRLEPDCCRMNGRRQRCRLVHSSIDMSRFCLTSDGDPTRPATCCLNQTATFNENELALGETILNRVPRLDRAARFHGCFQRMTDGWTATRRTARRSFSLPHLATRPVAGEQLRMSSAAFVHVVDDDTAVRESLGDLLRSMNYQVKLYGSASEF